MTHQHDQTTINKEVHITAWYFQNRDQLISFPRRMEYNLQEYTFAEGLRYLIHKSYGIVQLFDMTDGSNKYRLRFESNSQRWTLVSVRPDQAALC